MKHWLIVPALVGAVMLSGCEAILPETHILIEAKATKVALQNEKLAAEVREAEARAWAVGTSGAPVCLAVLFARV